MDNSIYIARQPIFDTAGKIAAYELFYRNTDENSVEVGNNMRATARVLVNALNYIGLNTLTHHRMAFIKVDDKAIMDDIIFAISPGHFILEILEDTTVSPELITRIERLHAKGYRFALNHYRLDNDFRLKFKDLMRTVEYVKVDVQGNDELASIIKELGQHKAKKIAQKIETKAQYDEARAIGFDYYQGYYFSEPDLIERENVDPDYNLLLELIYLLKTNAPMPDLLEKLNTSPYLVINLLKFIHLHEASTYETISSAEQALVLMGRERLANWLELMIYAERGKAHPESSEMCHQARHRACIMEEVAKKMGKGSSFENAAYLTGLLSYSESILHNDFPQLLRETRLRKDIAEALQKKRGDLGQLIHLMIAIETNDQHTINSILGQLQISQRALNEAMVAAYRRSSSPA